MTNMENWQKVAGSVADPDVVLVFLDGELQGMVVEADAEKGYVVKRTFDDCVVTMRGKVEITYKGKSCIRAEFHPRQS